MLFSITDTSCQRRLWISLHRSPHSTSVLNMSNAGESLTSFITRATSTELRIRHLRHVAFGPLNAPGGFAFDELSDDRRLKQRVEHRDVVVHSRRAVVVGELLTRRRQQHRQTRLCTAAALLPQHPDGRGRGVVLRVRVGAARRRPISADAILTDSSVRYAWLAMAEPVPQAGRLRGRRRVPAPRAGERPNLLRAPARWKPSPLKKG
jgi:hypothetical protein